MEELPGKVLVKELKRAPTVKFKIDMYLVPKVLAFVATSVRAVAERVPIVAYLVERSKSSSESNKWSQCISHI